MIARTPGRKCVEAGREDVAAPLVGDVLVHLGVVAREPGALLSPLAGDVIADMTQYGIRPDGEPPRMLVKVVDVRFADGSSRRPEA